MKTIKKFDSVKTMVEIREKLSLKLKFRSKLSYHFVRTFNDGKMNLNHLFQLIILFSKRF